MQDDRLMPHLTVLEAMTVSANLKLGKQTSSSAKRIVVSKAVLTNILYAVIVFPCMPHPLSISSSLIL
jgi:hypothetical protein